MKRDGPDLWTLQSGPIVDGERQPPGPVLEYHRKK